MLWRRLLPAEQGFVLQHFGAQQGTGWRSRCAWACAGSEIRGGRCA
jgi:hypothetical protein